MWGRIIILVAICQKMSKDIPPIHRSSGPCRSPRPRDHWVLRWKVTKRRKMGLKYDPEIGSKTCWSIAQWSTIISIIEVVKTTIANQATSAQFTPLTANPAAPWKMWKMDNLMQSPSISHRQIHPNLGFSTWAIPSTARRGTWGWSWWPNIAPMGTQSWPCRSQKWNKVGNMKHPNFAGHEVMTILSILDYLWLPRSSGNEMNIVPVHPTPFGLQRLKGSQASPISDQTKRHNRNLEPTGSNWMRWNMIKQVQMRKTCTCQASDSDIIKL